jgi:hypothetical protein
MIRISDYYRHRLHALDLRIPVTFFAGFHMLQSPERLYTGTALR